MTPQIPLHSDDSEPISFEMLSVANTVKVKSNKIAHGFESIYYFSRAVGLWPFTIVYNSKGLIEKTRVRVIDGAWFVVSICLYLTAIFYTYRDVKRASYSNVDSIAFFLHYLTQMMILLFGAIFGSVLNLINRNKLMNILEKFITFDSEVGSHFVVHINIYCIYYCKNASLNFRYRNSIFISTIKAKIDVLYSV